MLCKLIISFVVGNEPVVQPSSQAKNNVPPADSEKITAKASTGKIYTYTVTL